jgi:hypothetical protein
MRYEGWIAPAKPSPWPGAMLCLACDVRWARADTGQAREYATLGSWHIQCCTRHGDEYAITRTASGTTADSFWDIVRTGSILMRNVWIISTEFRAVAAVLGLWDRLESGNVTIAGRDHRVSRRVGAVPHLPGEGTPAGKGPPGGMDRGHGARELSTPLDTPKGPAPRGRGSNKAARGGVFIVEDPPIVLELMVDGGGSKITWVDAANYGIDLGTGGGAPSAHADQLAHWFLSAASTLHSLGPCGWQSTAGSQAMHTYRSVFHATPTLCHTEPRATALERAGLFGGRCEPFALGKVAGPVHLYDFRAMYPFLYSTTPVPCRLARVVHAPTVDELSALRSVGFLIAKVDIETDEPEYPYRAGPAVIYPVGRFTTVLSGAELQGAAISGHISRVRLCAVYEAEYALKRYAESLYRLRCKADRDDDRCLAQYIKRISNCLHGKFAQTDRRWEECPNAECPWEWAEWYHRLETGEFQRRRVVAGVISKEVMGGFSHGTIPAIAIAIAGAGRSRLLDCIRDAGWEHVHYCDTDALIVDDYGAESLTLAGWIRPGEWGYLQHVESADECTIHGVKRYSIGGRARCAGRRNGDVVGNGSGAPGARQPGIRERLARQLPPADWREPHPWQAGPGRYDRQREPGGRVRPIELDEWESK